MNSRRSIAARMMALALGAIAPAAAAPAEPTALARFSDWRVFTDTVDGERICYAATQAHDKAPRSADHGDVWFYVTSWASGRARNQPSLRVGYELRPDLPSKARVGRSAWSLFNVGSEAFADDDDDRNLVRAIERGLELRVEAVSDRGTAVAYHFSLKGSSDAISRAERACR